MKGAHQSFIETLETWWEAQRHHFEALAYSDGKIGNAYALRRHLLVAIQDTFAENSLLTDHQVRGALARYLSELSADLKSIAASGWGPELIPDDDILRSEFPEMLAELAEKRARIAELGSLFAAANEEDYEDDDDTGALPGAQVKTLKADLKEHTAVFKAAFKELKALAADLFTEIKVAGRLPAGAKKGDLAVKGKMTAPQFDTAQNILDLCTQLGFASERIDLIRASVETGSEAHGRAEERNVRLAKHKALTDEEKRLKAEVKATEKKQAELVEAARAKIDNDTARKVIIKRLHRMLLQSYVDYLVADQRACIAALENLHAKYAVTAADIEEKRDAAAAKLQWGSPGEPP